MEIDYEALKIISKNNVNKNKNAFDDSILLSSLLKLLSNIIYVTSTFTLNEVSLFVYSLNNWLVRKSQKSTTKYKPGTIIEFDCGLNFKGELSYRHTGIVFDEIDDMIFVAPTTSSDSYIEKTCEKENGVWYYKLVGISEGFDHDCVLMLNNIKMISKRRVIASFDNITNNDVGEKFFNDIKFEMMSHYFSKQCLSYESKISSLNSEIEKRDKQIQILDEYNKDLSIKVKEQKNKINSLYTCINKRNRKVIDKNVHH